jgi:hypothetical protein
MFPLDNLKPVPKGVTGADLIQEGCDRAGEVCGLILWETKRTKNWSDGWVGKLKADQLAAGGECIAELCENIDKQVYLCKADALSLFSAEKEFEVDSTLVVSDDHHIVAPLRDPF